MQKIRSPYRLLFIVLVLLITACSSPNNSSDVELKAELSSDELLSLIQEKTVMYFWDGAEPNSGLARERIHTDGSLPLDDNHIVTTGGTGFGLMALVVGVERGFISKSNALKRLEKIIQFLEHADRFHGAWPHWLDGRTGRVVPFSPKDDGADLVETAYLVQGLITVRQYLNSNNEREQALAKKITRLWQGVEWNWFRKNGEDVLYWHWSPNHSWEMDFPLEGYNETLITYILAASSPTHSIPGEIYHQGWAGSGGITSSNSAYGFDLVLNHNGSEEYGGPLFWAHYSFLGLDPRGLKDQYADYWVINQNHTFINRRWCVENPGGYEGYGEILWGLTASYTLNDDGTVGYAAHRPGDDRGVIAPTAALSSMPYTPQQSLDVAANLFKNFDDKLFGKYGFYDAMSVEKDFYPERYLAINQGPIVIMIENYRTNLLWNLFMSAPEIKKGLKKLGFESPHM